MKNYPKCRDKDIVVQESVNELMVYDLLTNKVHFLNETSAEIWKSCDGKTSISQIAENKNIPEEYVIAALSDLSEVNLMEGEYSFKFSPDWISRRSLLMKSTPTLFALPLLTTMLAPSSAQAQSNSCLIAGQTFELTPSPFFSNSIECALALIEEAKNVCCAGVINFNEFSLGPELCRGRCGDN